MNEPPVPPDSNAAPLPGGDAPRGVDPAANDSAGTVLVDAEGNATTDDPNAAPACATVVDDDGEVHPTDPGLARVGIDPPPIDPDPEPDDHDPTPANLRDDGIGHVPDQLPDAPNRIPPGVAAQRTLAVIAVLAMCYFGRELLVTLLLAMFLALVGNPVLTRLRRLYIPRWLGALIVVIGGLALTVAMGMTLAAPATDWVRQAPTELRQLAPKLKALVRRVDEANEAAASIANAAGAGNTTSAEPAPSAPKQLDLWDAISAAPRALMSFGAVVLLAYFFLVFGDSLQRNVISMLPDRSRKQLTSEILQTIEAEVSAYVGTITLINVVLGTILGLALWWLGLDLKDAFLWGTVAALLNFAPYVGPITGILFMGLVGVVAFDSPTKMLLPAAIFLGLHVLESQVITPIILGKRMAISPLVLLLWLMLWGWLWGIAGLLLAVPMLVVCKIVASRVEAWEGWARVIE
jgi:predicted PurR-regulated permease PerM